MYLHKLQNVKEQIFLVLEMFDYHFLFSFFMIEHVLNWAFLRAGSSTPTFIIQTSVYVSSSLP